ncbi:MAG: hypothetical protein JW800_06615 [Candidatus Omnitrophica bacterium]|nr:hypothetical protein [Candidatus Omnitrophota bacterium]
MVKLRRIEARKIGDLLVEKKVISYEQLQKALKIQKEKGGLLGSLLVEAGYATEEQIAQVITIQYGLPYLPLSNYELDKEMIRLIPEETAKKFCLVAIDKMGDTLTIALANPLNVDAIAEVERITTSKVQTFVSTMTDINNVIKKYYKDV